MHRASLIALLALTPVLAGATCERRPVIPEIVEVPVHVVVAVPEALSRDCDAVPKRDNTVEEAARLANARAASLAECTGRMRAIRELKR